MTTPAATPVLVVNNLDAYYGPSQAVFNLSFVVHSGQALSLQGANGAGKSSTIKALMGLIARKAKQINIANVDTIKYTPDEIANLGVGYVPENRRIFTRLTALENLQLAQRNTTQTSAAHVWNVDNVLDSLPQLKPLLNRQGDALSGGEQRMLAVGRALMRSPRLLLLDEPCEGVAPKVADAIANVLTLAMQRGVAVLISESQEGFASRLNARVLVLHAGSRVIDQSTDAS